MRRASGPWLRLYHLYPMRLGTVRVTHAIQLPLLSLADGPPILDQRERGGGTSFVGTPSRSVLNPPSSTGMGFWSINPYVGCEFGCSYCYARDTHRWLVERAVARIELEVSSSDEEPSSDTALTQLTSLSPPDAFERQIFVKTEVADVLRRTLDPTRIGTSAIVIGTATDPYQPAERRFTLTRRILQTLLPYRDLTIGIITKSALVTRDLDLLVPLAERHDLRVNLSLATTNVDVLRKLEPRTPLPHARLRALRLLTASGIHAGVMLAPILPGITDGWDSLARVMEGAKEAGARFVSGIPLRLGKTARERLLAVLRREFPELVSRYEQHYGKRTNASSAYRKALARRIRLLQEVYGFPVAPSHASGTRQRNRAPTSGPRRGRARSVSRPTSPAA